MATDRVEPVARRSSRLRRSPSGPTSAGGRHFCWCPRTP